MPIHPTAIIASGATIHDSAHIGPGVVIGTGVVIGPQTQILAGSYIEGPTSIGAANCIGPMAAIGTPPQDVKYHGELTRLEIGDRNIIREFVSMHRGTTDGPGVTRVGNDGMFMAASHVAHDCVVGDRVIFANSASVAGHVVVGDGATLGGFAVVHQFCRIGTYCYIGGMAGINKDIPPYVLAEGTRSNTRAVRINSVGLRRSTFFTDEAISCLEKAFRILFRDNMLLQEALEKASTHFPNCAEVATLVDFFRTSTRGVVRKSNGND